MYYKVKIRRADKLFSDYIREKANWSCEKCEKVCRINGEWIGKLEASHYWIRSHENTRYDEENVHSLCFNCHKRMGEYRSDEKGEYDLWMKKLLGEKRYQLLKIRANTTGKRDDKLAVIYVKGLISNIN